MITKVTRARNGEEKNETSGTGPHASSSQGPTGGTAYATMRSSSSATCATLLIAAAAVPPLPGIRPSIVRADDNAFEGALEAWGLSDEELAADIAIKLEEIIEQRKVRDWVNNLDVQNQMRLEIEDYLYSLKGRYEIQLTPEDMDQILDSVIEVARQRDSL